MARLPEYYNIGNRENLTNENLLEIIEDMYQQLALAVNQKPDINVREIDGQVTDTFSANGTINLNNLTQKVEMLVARTATAVTWKTL